MKRGLLILAAVALVYIFLNPYRLYPDGQGYYSYLPSLFVDGDIDFYNEFTQMRIPVPLAVTPTGYISNIWSFGSAFFWTPFYVAGKLLATVDEYPYGNWYWFWINLGTIAYGLMAYFLIAQMLKESGRSASRWIVGALAFLGTPMFFYTFAVSSTAHGITAFAATLFLWYWVQSYRSPQAKSRYVLLGIFAGFAAMVRSQEALFSLALFGELAVRALRKELPLKDAFSYGGIFCAAFVAGLLPQLFIWKIIYGSFFAAPAQFNLSFDYFALSQVLFSSYHGILYWTPVFFLAFAGLAVGTVRAPALYGGMLLAFIGQLMVNACCVAFWEGYAFGLRQMTSSLPLVAFGLAELVRVFHARRGFLRVAGWTVLVLPVLWTTGLLFNYYLELDLLGYLSPSQIFQVQAALSGKLLLVAKKLFAQPRAPFSLFILCVGIAFAYMALLKKGRVLLEKKKYTPVLAALTIVIAGYSLFIVRAHWNKPAYALPPGATISADELGAFFVGQVNDIKVKYNLK